MDFILVTGASRGLGKAIALGLAKAGFGLLLHYHQDRHEIEEVANQLSSFGPKPAIYQGNFSTIEGVERFLSSLSLENRQLYGLINNVGPYLLGPLTQINPADLTTCLHLNCTAPLMLIQKLLPHLKKSKGCVINIGMCGIRKTDTHCPGYTLAKEGLYHMTRSLAKELLPEHVRVNMVSPGYLIHSVDLPKGSGKERLVVPEEEVARAVSFLADRAQGYITGQNIEVAAGARL